MDLIEDFADKFSPQATVVIAVLFGVIGVLLWFPETSVQSPLIIQLLPVIGAVASITGLFYQLVIRNPRQREFRQEQLSLHEKQTRILETLVHSPSNDGGNQNASEPLNLPEKKQTKDPEPLWTNETNIIQEHVDRAAEIISLTPDGEAYLPDADEYNLMDQFLVEFIGALFAYHAGLRESPEIDIAELSQRFDIHYQDVIANTNGMGTYIKKLDAEDGTPSFRMRSLRLSEALADLERTKKRINHT